MNHILIFILILLFWGCHEAEKTTISPLSNYNIEANKIIRQVIDEDSGSCDCLLKISEKSIIKIRQEETPIQAPTIKKNIMQTLEINSDKELDSLVKLSENFILDKNILEDNHIRLINTETLMSAKKNSTICSKGIMIIDKPIFSKDFKTVVINSNRAFFCSPGFIATYKSKNGKWIEANSR